MVRVQKITETDKRNIYEIIVEIDGEYINVILFSIQLNMLDFFDDQKFLNLCFLKNNPLKRNQNINKCSEEIYIILSKINKFYSFENTKKILNEIKKEWRMYEQRKIQENQ